MSLEYLSCDGKQYHTKKKKKTPRKQRDAGAKLKELPVPQAGALWDTKTVGVIGLQPINRINIIPY